MSEYTMGPYELAAYRSGATIREIARRGQDTLTRIWLAGKHQERPKYAENALKQVAHCYDMSPPQTLGELCLDTIIGKLQRAVTLVGGETFTQVGRYIDSPSGKDIHALRRAMYSRNRPTVYEQIDSAWWGTLRSMAEAHDREIAALLSGIPQDVVSDPPKTGE